MIRGKTTPTESVRVGIFAVQEAGLAGGDCSAANDLHPPASELGLIREMNQTLKMNL